MVDPPTQNRKEPCVRACEKAFIGCVDTMQPGCLERLKRCSAQCGAAQAAPLPENSES